MAFALLPSTGSTSESALYDSTFVFAAHSRTIVCLLFQLFFQPRFHPPRLPLGAVAAAEGTRRQGQCGRGRQRAAVRVGGRVPRQQQLVLCQQRVRDGTDAAPVGSEGGLVGGLGRRR